MIGNPQCRAGGTVSGRATAQEGHSLRDITILDPCPASIDGPLHTPERESLFGRDHNQLVFPLAERHVASDEPKSHDAERQARSQRRRMCQPPSLSDSCVASSQGLSGIAKTEED